MIFGFFFPPPPLLGKQGGCDFLPVRSRGPAHLLMLDLIYIIQIRNRIFTAEAADGIRCC